MYLILEDSAYESNVNWLKIKRKSIVLKRLTPFTIRANNNHTGLLFIVNADKKQRNIYYSGHVC